MLQNSPPTHDRFINKQILDEFEGMVSKYMSIGMDEETAKKKVIELQRSKYNK